MHVEDYITLKNVDGYAEEYSEELAGKQQSVLPERHEHFSQGTWFEGSRWLFACEQTKDVDSTPAADLAGSQRCS